MPLPHPNIEDALRDGILIDNRNHRDDQEKVLYFIRLRGRPNRPVDEWVTPRTQDDFARGRRRLPDQFFEPFNRLLRLINFPPIRVEPDMGAISEWNKPDFSRRMVAEVEKLLDGGNSPRLVPTLVALFLNLEREHSPSLAKLAEITAIAIPGSRTYNRAAEAFRAYLLGKGNAVLVTSGKAPYYDEDNQGYEVTESEASAAYLRLLGIPPGKIFFETASRDTVENVEFLVDVVRKIAKDRSIIKPSILLVTEPFHMARYRFNAEQIFEGLEFEVQLYSIASRGSRYWAETYFITDVRSGWTRDQTMGVVFNEYLKIAFDVSAERRPMYVKEHPMART